MSASEDFEFGPAMAALKPLQQRFVLAMASDPFGNGAKWARMAGYSDVKERCKVTAHRLLHSPAIEAAVLEVGQSMLTTVGPILAAHVILRAAADSKNKKQLRAAEMLANRVGLHEVQEVHVTKTDRTGAAMVARIKALAAKHGLDAERLLGGNLALPAPEPKEVNLVSRETGAGDA